MVSYPVSMVTLKLSNPAGNELNSIIGRSSFSSFISDSPSNSAFLSLTYWDTILGAIVHFEESHLKNLIFESVEVNFRMLVLSEFHTRT